MIKFKRLSIKQKLVTVTVGLLLLVAVSITFFFPFRQEQVVSKYLSQKAVVIAHLIAYNSEAGLNFSDSSAVKETLNGLNELKDVEFALVLNKDGSVFASYPDEKAASLVTNFKEKLASGQTGKGAAKPWQFEEEGRLLVVNPIISKGGQVGTVLLGLSQMEMRADVTRSRLIALVAGLVILLLGSYGFSYYAEQIVKPLKKLEKAAHRIARGNVDVLIDVENEDEIGALANSFRELVKYFQGVAAAAEALSEGNLEAEVMAHSENDVIAKNFLALRHLMEETRRLIQFAQQGKLQARGDASRFQGVYRDLVLAINQMMDVVVTPINEAAAILEQVAERNLQTRMQGEYAGDYAKIKRALNTAVAHLDEGLQQVTHRAEQVALGALEIRATAQELSEGSVEQANTLQAVTEHLQEITSDIQKNAVSTKRAKELADAAHTSVGKGVACMERLSTAISKIKASADATAKIIKTIDEIAFQTNLLALNAAVEAARAGESGKGFAVVAEEVRNLAMRSAESAHNTAQMIEESVHNAEAGVRINQEALADLAAINQQVSQVTSVMLEITAATDSQRNGVNRMAAAVQEVNHLTEQNAGHCENSAQASETLSEQAEALQSLVATFHISGRSK